MYSKSGNFVVKIINFEGKINHEIKCTKKFQQRKFVYAELYVYPQDPEILSEVIFQPATVSDLNSFIKLAPTLLYIQ